MNILGKHVIESIIQNLQRGAREFVVHLAIIIIRRQGNGVEYQEYLVMRISLIDRLLQIYAEGVITLLTKN